MHSKSIASSGVIVLSMCASRYDTISEFTKQELQALKLRNDGEIYGKRSKGDRKRNPRWRRQ